MPFNLLIFPILGGYYLLIRSELFRYLHQRIDRQKLIFNSIIAGVGLLILAFILKTVWIFASPLTAGWCRDQVPIPLPYAGTTLLSFFLGIAFAEISNLVINKKKCIRFAIQEIGSELELLLDYCANEDELVQITLKNDKVYVGWVLTLPIPQHSSFVKIAPAFSGVRNKESKTIEFTTAYLDVYSTYISKGKATNVKLLSNLVIKTEEILSATRFDIDMYERFLNLQKESLLK